MDYIAQVAELLKNGESVVFYTVGSDTFLCIKELKFRFGLLPTAVCDGDPKKQGRTWRGLEGLTVQSPDEVMERLPETNWLIPSLNYRVQIIGYLTQERGIPAERIVNYEPVRKFRSCLHLNQSIFYDRTGELSFCCGKACPRTEAGEKPDAAALRTLRDSLLKAIEEDRIPEDSLCKGCDLIKEDYFPVQPKGMYVSYFCNSVCNYRCSYCNVAHEGPVGKDAGHHTLHQVISALREEGMLSADYCVEFATSGEPTLYPGRKEVYQEFDGDRFSFLTNGYLYDPDLFAMMGRKRTHIMDSIDAGTREMYLRIKGVDGFERVREHMKAYAQASLGIVVLKYIFLPGINDLPEEVDGFIDFCLETDAVLAVISVDYYNVERTTEHTQKMIRRMAEGLEKKGILCASIGRNEPAKLRNMVNSMMSEGN